MRKRVDRLSVIGKRFGKLVVLDVYFKGKYSICTCVCDCGVVKEVNYSNLNNGTTQSCGCLRREWRSAAAAKSKKRNIPRLYRIWSGIKYRCSAFGKTAGHSYADRGIKVCEEWKNDYDAFKQWALENGYEDSLTIERIDVNGNYSPDNCKWIPLAEQVKNKQNSWRLDDGRWAKDVIAESGLPYNTVWQRVFTLGWSLEEALQKPLKRKIE